MQLFHIFCLCSLALSLFLYYKACSCGCDEKNSPTTAIIPGKEEVWSSSRTEAECNSTLILRNVKHYLERPEPAPIFLLPESRNTIDTRLWIHAEYLWCNLLRIQGSVDLCNSPIIPQMQTVCSSKYQNESRSGFLDLSIMAHEASNATVFKTIKCKHRILLEFQNFSNST